VVTGELLLFLPKAPLPAFPLSQLRGLVAGVVAAVAGRAAHHRIQIDQVRAHRIEERAIVAG
jgi:hypothetical protein